MALTKLEQVAVKMKRQVNDIDGLGGVVSVEMTGRIGSSGGEFRITTANGEVADAIALNESDYGILLGGEFR